MPIKKPQVSKEEMDKNQSQVGAAAPRYEKTFKRLHKDRVVSGLVGLVNPVSGGKRGPGDTEKLEERELKRGKNASEMEGLDGASDKQLEAGLPIQLRSAQ
jgi:hypothetical protein